MTAPTPDLLWPLVIVACVTLVVCGHVTLESGLVRAKHSVNAAAKALVLVGLSVLLTWMFGFGLMAAGGSLVGTGPFMPGDGGLDLILAMTVIAAGGTILSGPLAERATLRGYAALLAVLIVAILPFTLHWAWARGESPGWLLAFGYVDLAGAGVLHVAAGAAAVTAAALLGPRNGRFSGARRTLIVQSQSFPFAALGVMLSWLGWFGIAVGKAMAGGSPAAPVVINLLISGAAAIMTAFAVNQWRPSLVNVAHIIQAALAGVIAASAAAHLLHPLGAAVLGTAGAGAALAGGWLLVRWRIDDATGLAAAHLFAGMLGVLAVAFCTPSELPDMMANQVTGLVAILGWSMAVMGAAGYGLQQVMLLRVPPEDERIGLNVSEHAMTTDVAMLVSQLGVLNVGSGAFAYLEADQDGELGQIAREYNRAIDIFNTQIQSVQEKLSLAESAADQASDLNAQLAAEIQDKDRRLEAVNREVAFLTDQVGRALIAVENLKGVRTGILRLLGRTFRQPIERLHLMAQRAAASRHQGDIDALIEAAREESTRLARRLADVLDYAQASAIEGPPAGNQAPLEKLIGEMNLLFRPRAEAKGIRFRVVWTPEVSGMAINAVTMRRILGELVGHAIDTSPKGGMVNFSAKQDQGGRLLIDVVDSGAGVSPGELAQALDPLAADEAGGKGPDLGLALVKKLVELHGGSMTIRSKPGAGTQVRISVPTDRLAGPLAA